ncbi:MAG: hypothetical protein BWK75_03265 [Candidatus Altiarchaeales archaeon A3]|nr:MAG: hypothetical protein BWK75_03265 [Candidatus Altiarchaeales archaeon A3]
MKTITVNVSGELEELMNIDEKLIVRATRHIIKERLWELKNSMEESQEKMDCFREKYALNFDGFEKKIKKGEFSEPLQHEDYNEWFFWKSVSERIQKIMNTYGKFIRIEKCQEY